MDMEIVWRAVWTLPRIVCWKLRYRGRIALPWVQSLGPGSRLHVRKGAALLLGRETVSRGGLTLRAESGRLTVGDKCFFNTNCSVTCMEEVTIGRGCHFANNLVIVDHDHDYRRGWGYYRSAPVRIGNDVWVGANCVILKGADIGDRCVIAAGSVVSGRVEPGSLYIQRREKIARGSSERQ